MKAYEDIIMLTCAHMTGFLCFTTFCNFLQLFSVQSNILYDLSATAGLTVASAAAAAPFETNGFTISQTIGQPVLHTLSVY